LCFDCPDNASPASGDIFAEDSQRFHDFMLVSILLFADGYGREQFEDLIKTYPRGGTVREELGFASRPWQESIRDHVEWFRAEGMLPMRR